MIGKKKRNLDPTREQRGCARGKAALALQEGNFNHKKEQSTWKHRRHAEAQEAEGSILHGAHKNDNRPRERGPTQQKARKSNSRSRDASAQSKSSRTPPGASWNPAQNNIAGGGREARKKSRQKLTRPRHGERDKSAGDALGTGRANVSKKVKGLRRSGERVHRTKSENKKKRGGGEGREMGVSNANLPVGTGGGGGKKKNTHRGPGCGQTFPISEVVQDEGKGGVSRPKEAKDANPTEPKRCSVLGKQQHKTEKKVPKNGQARGGS